MKLGDAQIGSTVRTFCPLTEMPPTKDALWTWDLQRGRSFI